MGREGRFGRFVCYALDYAMRRLLEEFMCTWESTKDGRIQVKVCGEEIIINQAIIVKQFGVNAKRVIDALNVLVKETQIALKNIVGLDVFVEKDQWSVIHMKEEFHAKFATILYIIYQWKKLVYFNNKIAISFNLENQSKMSIGILSY
jgi:hypothetical protein